MSCRLPHHLLVGMLVLPGLLRAGDATITVEQVSLPTYAFSDPSPLANLGRIYPYHRFDGFSITAVAKSWTMVKLDNPYLTVWIAPEIGGKVWGALDKKSGRAFIYRNPVVKFRDVALRGPWTAGGIEFNVGIIGHAPTTATPVEWTTRTRGDGTVDCVVGALDLASRTSWRVAIRLAPDAASFATDGWWDNPTGLHQSCYQWTTAAAEARDDLRVIHPGAQYLGHGGDVHPWPLDAQGRDQSRYAATAHLPDSSFHVIGQQAEFFGGWWDQLGRGYGHWSPAGDKPGQKLWLWSQARSGAIWRDLLTDAPAGQYIEMQSGLMHSQADDGSSRTPFKHAALEPGAALAWEERWFPLLDIGGMVAASPQAALNVVRTGDQLTIGVSPLAPLDQELRVEVAGMPLLRQRLQAATLEARTVTVDLSGHPGVVTVALGDGLRWRSDAVEATRLHRPVESVPPGADHQESAEDAFLTGEEHLRQRDHALADADYERCLEREPRHLRALTRSAELRLRQGDHEVAAQRIATALAIDATDAGANLIHGLVSRAQDRLADAADGFAWATRSPAYRTIANLQLAELAIRARDWPHATLHAARAGGDETAGRRGRLLAAIIARKRGDPASAQAILAALIEADPLDHGARFERALLDPAQLPAFRAPIRGEFPDDTLLELALWYEGMDLVDEALAVLANASDRPLVELRRAWLLRQRDPALSRTHLDRFAAQPVRGVFPFRGEDLPALAWATTASGGWKAPYYQALLLAGLGRRPAAVALLEGLHDDADEAAFYLNRMRLRTETTAPARGRSLQDLTRAQALDPGDWRIPHLLAQRHHQDGGDAAALMVVATAREAFPQVQALQMDHANALNATGHPAEALALLDGATWLPFEGSVDGREIHRTARLLLAIAALTRGAAATAAAQVTAARSWPERLGAGRPPESDERLEDFAAALTALAAGDPAAAQAAYRRVLAATRRPAGGPVTLLAALASAAVGDAATGSAMLAEWQTTAKPGDAAAPWAAAVFAARSLSPTTSGFPPVPRLDSPWVDEGGHHRLALVAALARLEMPDPK